MIGGEERGRSISGIVLNYDIPQPLDITEVMPCKVRESGGTPIRVRGSKICVPEYTTVTVGDGSDCTNVT